MALKVLYQSEEHSKNQNEFKHRFTLYGKESEIDTYISGLNIGGYYNNLGYLTSYVKSNYGADLYQVELEYSVSYSNDGYTNVDDTVVGEKSATLSSRTLQMPLEGHTNYLTNWNYYLIGSAEDQSTAISTPQWWSTATNIIIPIADRQKYRWVSSISEIPQDKDSNGNYWFIVEQPTKPGVQYYEMSYYTVTEKQKFKSASAAGSAVGSALNTLTSPSNTFGLGGSWKFDSAEVYYSGKYWYATKTYTRSITVWDSQIYSY